MKTNQKKYAQILLLLLSLASVLAHKTPINGLRSFTEQHYPIHKPSQNIQIIPNNKHSLLISNALQIRGGQIEGKIGGISQDHDQSSTKIMNAIGSLFGSFLSMSQFVRQAYSDSLQDSPIITKSITAALIFGLSDCTAQILQNKKNSATDQDFTLNWKRSITASLVGLCYFGPVAHKWYTMIFHYFPDKSILSTLKKATLGQLFFGPTLMSVFFGSSLISSNSFTISNWVQKIKRDLPEAWLAGIRFWPPVDLISYSFVPPQWIPLFVNMCSFVWTIYLSTVTFRG